MNLLITEVAFISPSDYGKTFSSHGIQMNCCQLHPKLSFLCVIFFFILLFCSSILPSQQPYDKTTGQDYSVNFKGDWDFSLCFPSPTLMHWVLYHNGSPRCNLSLSIFLSLLCGSWGNVKPLPSVLGKDQMLEFFLRTWKLLTYTG